MDLFLADETDTTRPCGRWIIKDVKYFESIWMLSDHGVKLFLEKDVLKVDVGVNETEFCRVLRIFECGTDDLKHWGYSGTAGNHAKLAREGRVVFELTFGTLDANLITDFKQADMARDVAFFI